MGHLISIEIDHEVATRLLERIGQSLETSHASDEADPDLDELDRAVRYALENDDA